MLGLIFRKAQDKIQDPAKLRQIIVELIHPCRGDRRDLRDALGQIEGVLADLRARAR